MREYYAGLLDTSQRRALFANTAVSNVGFWIIEATQVWLILELTGSPAMVGLLALFHYGPFVVLGLFGGIWVDRFGPLRLALIAQFGFVASFAVLNIVALTNNLTADWIFAVAVLRGLLITISRPARQALVGMVVDGSRLRDGVSFNMSIAGLSRVIGPTIAGVLIATLGAKWSYVPTMVTSLAGVVLLACLRDVPSIAVSKSSGSRLDMPAEAIRYVRQDRYSAALLTSLLLLVLIPISFLTTLPVFTRQVLQASSVEFGLLYSSYNVGAVAGALSEPFLRSRWLRLTFVFPLILGLAELLFAFVNSFAIAVALLVLSGFCIMLFLARVNGELLARSPTEMYGRIGGLYAYIEGALGPMGAIIVGLTIDQLGIRIAFIVCATTAFLSGIIGFLIATPKRDKP